MPATRRKSQDSPVTEPYTLVGTPKPQLTALMVTALKSHLKYYRLATTGNKAALVDRLYNHLRSLQPGNADPASAVGSQANNLVTQMVNSWALEQQLLLLKQQISMPNQQVPSHNP